VGRKEKGWGGERMGRRGDEDGDMMERLDDETRREEGEEGRRGG
jgi:hypothetical protein